MRLRCVTRYYRSEGYGPYTYGEVIPNLTPDEVAWLCADSPQSFEVLPDEEPETRAVETPPADRMVRRGRTRKTG